FFYNSYCNSNAAAITSFNNITDNYKRFKGETCRSLINKKLQLLECCCGIRIPLGDHCFRKIITVGDVNSNSASSHHPISQCFTVTAHHTLWVINAGYFQQPHHLF
ncbi:hypothetical protein AMELA_G00057590, partial [Ameiurus melas]